VDETLTVKVIKFDRDSKRRYVSHSRYVNDIRKEAKDRVAFKHLKYRNFAP